MDAREDLPGEIVVAARHEPATRLIAPAEVEPERHACTVADDEVDLFLAWLTNHTAISKRVQGYRPAPAYIEFWNADEWWLTS